MTGIICLLWVAFGLSAALLPGLHAHVHTAGFFRHESFLKFVTCPTKMNGALAIDPAAWVGSGGSDTDRHCPVQCQASFVFPPKKICV